MRRIEQNLGEKRVLLGRKNNLRVTYERLNLEEKSFISSTKFNQRQLLSRHSKLRQFQSTAQGNKRSNSEAQLNNRTSFPNLLGTNESRGYQNNLTLPYSRNGLTSYGKAKRAITLLGKEGNSIVKPSRLNTSSKLRDAAFENVANEKRNDKSSKLRNTTLKRDEVKNNSKSEHSRGSGIQVGDIIAYSTKFGKGEKPEKATISSDRKEMDITGSQISEVANENKNCAFGKTIWNIGLESSTERNLFDTATTPGNETNDWLPRNTVLNESNDFGINSIPANTNTRPDKLERSDSALISDNTQSQDGPKAQDLTEYDDVFLSFNSDSQADSQTENHRQTSVPSVPALVSRTPSWNGTEALPALGRIRRGSFCDVKTFTSGKVLDLLSSCEVPTAEKKTSKKYLDVVDDENLKYCRYLRSVTPEEAMKGGESLEIPQKYRPSKNIIIGHTKVFH